MSSSLLDGQARDVPESGELHQGAARDVHGHGSHGREPGGDDQQVKGYFF